MTDGLTLLVGGARSGKSRLAARLAQDSGRPVIVIATGQPGDEEMAERIRRHQRERPPEWTTVEEPLDLEAALRDAAGDGFVIVDCLTLWVANLLDEGQTDEAIEVLAALAVDHAAARHGPTVVVSNEVGLGIVPMHPVGRRYADLMGRVNTRWARAADRTLFMVAGRALRLDDPQDLLDG
jgi:adenosylcobinamide kinase / adenosylcobinamide-phosphate guanylyltransferase